MGARKQKTKKKREPNPTGYVERAAPQLAEGTRRNLDAEPTKGLCFATRCHTVDQFISTFKRYCEDSAIFIPGGSRAVGATVAFSFELANDESVLLGVGTVIEELTTADNRFGRTGILISVKKLKPESIDVFKRMLAARNEPQVDRQTPNPRLGRAMTAPIPLQELRNARRPTRPIEVQIPPPGERTSPKPRSTTLLGLPTIPKAADKQAVVRIPAMSPRQEAKGTRPFPLAEPAPTPALATPIVEPTADAVPGPDEDTFHDDFPFALRNELRLIEQRAQAAPVVDVDSGWDIEPTPSPTAQVVLTREALDHAAAQESSATHEPIALPPPPLDEVGVSSLDADAIPVPIGRVASDAATTPKGAALREHATQLARTTARHPRRWAAHVAVASTTFVVVVAITAFVGSQWFVETDAATSSDSTRPANPASSVVPMTPAASTPVGDEPRIVLEQSAAPHVMTTAEQRWLAYEQPATVLEQPVIAAKPTVAEQQVPRAPQQPAAAPPQKAAEPRLTIGSPRVAAPKQKRTAPTAPRAIKAQPTHVVPTRAKRDTSKKLCNSLDCL
ncbi:MAG TPA: hypothetical protein VIV40_39960 [Kofleriaceae bacterium]